MVLTGPLVFTGGNAWHDDPVSLLPGFLGSALLTVVVGYVIGVIPAAVTGVIRHMFAQSIRSDRAWIGACSLVGSVCAGVAAPMLGLVDLGTSLMLMLCGGVAGAVCGWKLRRDRWPAHALRP